MSVILCCLCIIVIVSQWTENKPNEDERYNKFKIRSHIFHSIGEGITLLKRPEIFTLGIIDSMYNCAIQVLIFLWTPVLQITAENKNINPGMCFIIMIISYLTQNKILELLNLTIKIDYFILTTIYYFIFSVQFFLIYYVDSFVLRLTLLSLINVF
jgi:hypothetical protein